MRLSLSTPVVTAVPGGHLPWERGAGIDELAEIARAADALGYEFLSCSEHVVVPEADADVRGATYWDPLATFGYLAACTTRIRFATYVLVLGYHHPLEIAKRYGTLDVVSGGRLILGVGVGSLREEFDVLGVPFADRGVRADDALRALRAALSARVPSYRGSHYAFDGLVVEPHAVQPRVPLWVGGRSARSLRRAVDLADGWAPFWLRPEAVAGLLSTVELPPGFEVVIANEDAFDPVDDPEGTRETLTALAEVGTTIVHARFRHRSMAHYLEQIEALPAIARDVGAGAPR